MPLELVDPVNGDVADAVLIANNNAAIEEAFNSLEDEGSISSVQIADNAITNDKLSPGLKVTVGATPPVSPTNGDTWIYTPTGNGQSWQFIYRHDLDATYPWFFIGGGSYRLNGTPPYTHSADPVPTTAWKFATGFCPVFTAPFGGYYDINWNASMVFTGGSSLAFFAPSINDADPSGSAADHPGQGFTSDVSIMTGFGQTVALTEGDTLRITFWSELAFSLVASTFRIEPVRLSP